MIWPQPTRRDHERFCQVEGWTLVRNARGRTGTHHITYELVLTDGRVLRTRVSHPVDRTRYGRGIWQHILRDQLDVDEAVFWACVRDEVLPDRGRPAVPRDALPADLVHLLITQVGLSEAEVAKLGKEEAIARLTRYWTEG
ncbi:cytotoxic translational repressor of toxin-antitoxin stability system [Marinitenerispora sediminis]|uniref:Cytotoxic translational repressor of toxin-antitoxin stability system n=1 Tax=Marinitenerispora sediminis TaxID=1931232 RepID=A0A368TB97_9ACTN|nr:cytotoxic translational repressor of toxin-antitoxin stability system [Marinitenerispora sediminis]RCV56965.1 cytotoxic translational repressor of toxin-antitoxin stability system [Marinitenerispora sediminis]RCV60170.1 cytotoxic translational repressor of toxin-antitoxin stability system [Marinitenerispora sediminis]RCV62124.1 cytotoxic translational repressor of toxin-antitoxin stability system [Marinitenerispora sediminis]